MAGITLAQAQTKLTNALSALDKAIEAEQYSHSGAQSSFSVTRKIESLQKAVDYWDNKIHELTDGTGLILSQVAPE